MPILEVKKIKKSFGTNQVLKEVSLTRVMTSLPMGATMRLTTCSRTTLKKIWRLVMPST